MKIGKKGKGLGTDLPPEVVAEFTKWCNERGYVKSQASAAAFRLLMSLPLALREWAMVGDMPSIAKWFEEVDFQVAKSKIESRGKEASQSQPGRQGGEARKAGGNGR